MGDIERGQWAQRMLEDDAGKDVLASLDAKYVKALKDATIPEARELWWHRIKVLEDVQQELRRIRDSGVRAERVTG